MPGESVWVCSASRCLARAREDLGGRVLQRVPEAAASPRRLRRQPEHRRGELFHVRRYGRPSSRARRRLHVLRVLAQPVQPELLTQPGPSLWERYLVWRDSDAAKTACESARSHRLSGAAAAPTAGNPGTHVDQVILLVQAGKTKHEETCQAGDLAREVMPKFHDAEREHQGWKESVLAGRRIGRSSRRGSRGRWPAHSRADTTCVPPRD